MWLERSSRFARFVRPIHFFSFVCVSFVTAQSNVQLGYRTTLLCVWAFVAWAPTLSISSSSRRQFHPHVNPPTPMSVCGVSSLGICGLLPRPLPIPLTPRLPLARGNGPKTPEVLQQ